MGFSAGNGVLIMQDVVLVHLFVNTETSFPMKTFKLPTFGFHQTEIGSEPRGRDGKGNRSVF